MSNISSKKYDVVKNKKKEIFSKAMKDYIIEIFLKEAKPLQIIFLKLDDSFELRLSDDKGNILMKESAEIGDIEVDKEDNEENVFFNALAEEMSGYSEVPFWFEKDEMTVEERKIEDALDELEEMIPLSFIQGQENVTRSPSQHSSNFSPVSLEP